MTNRPSTTYRASRRNLAKARKLVWRKLERESGATVRVMLPRWAWEMPKKVPGTGVVGSNEPGLVTRYIEPGSSGLPYP